MSDNDKKTTPAQRYTHPVACERMSNDQCPECGTGVEEHSGWGGPGCTLTDNGVAERIHQYRQDLRVEDACRVMHDAYEAAAVQAGWETQERSRKPWEDVPEANKATMRAAVSALMEHLGTHRRPSWDDKDIESKDED